MKRAMPQRMPQRMPHAVGLENPCGKRHASDTPDVTGGSAHERAHTRTHRRVRGCVCVNNFRMFRLGYLGHFKKNKEIANETLGHTLGYALIHCFYIGLKGGL